MAKERKTVNKGGSRTAETSKMQLFVITVNGLQPLTIFSKFSIWDVAAVLDPPLVKKYVKASDLTTKERKEWNSQNERKSKCLNRRFNRKKNSIM